MNIVPLGDSAVLVLVGETLDAATATATQAFAATLAAAPLAGVIECVPANVSITVYYDPVRVPSGGKGVPPHERVRQWIEAAAATVDRRPPTAGRLVTIPVCYGGEYGPDLEAVAAAHGLSAAEVVALHSSGEYFVSAVGFTPGFAYLGGLPARLHTARRKTPRTRVPAGSVAIGGAQTGIYPFETPGGWNLIGRTPWRLFSAPARPPALLQMGDRVRFQSGTAEESATSMFP
jgi:inhibitor of KinA